MRVISRTTGMCEIAKTRIENTATVSGMRFGRRIVLQATAGHRPSACAQADEPEDDRLG